MHLFRLKSAVCMVAYANYYTDARIKNYVEALLKKKIRVDVFALGYFTEKKSHPLLKIIPIMKKYRGNSNIAYILSYLIFFIIAFTRITLSFIRRRYSLIHVHNMPNFLVFSGVIPKLCGSKVILDIHDTMPELYAAKFDKPLTYPLIQILVLEQSMSTLFADCVITTNELQKKVLVHHGIQSSKIDIIMNCPNQRIFFPRDLSQRFKEFTLVYHGTIVERSGFDLMLKALAYLKQDGIKVKLKIYGDGDYLKKAITLRNRLGLQEEVFFNGTFVAVEELRPLLIKAHAGIVANYSKNEFYENYMLPIKLLQYISMNIPAIVPKLKVIKYYFKDNMVAYFEPDNDMDLARTIRELAKNQDLLEQIEKAAQKFTQEYNWEMMEKKYLDLVANLLSNK